MKSLLKIGLITALVATTAHAGCNSCSDCYGKTWFSQRDQGSHQYLIMPMTVNQRHQFNREESYGDLAVTMGYRQNWRRCKQAAYFLTPGGYLKAGLDNSTSNSFCANVRASDLGLSTTFSGCAQISPKYADFVTDLDLYIGWDTYIQGLWSELRIPLIHTRWNAKLCSSTFAGGGTNYCSDGSDCECFVTTDSSASRAVVYTTLADALIGNQTFGKAPALCAGKLGNCTRTATGLGGLRLTLGYDFWRREKGHLGLAIDVAFPVWNRPCSTNSCAAACLFEPKVGSQHMWKVGGVLTGACLLWDRSKDQRLDFAFDGRVYGAFGGKTTRMLGLHVGGQMLFNHYLLLKQYCVTGDTVNFIKLERAANLLRTPVQSKALMEAEVTAMLNYRHNGFIAALGYNFFGRGAECLHLCGANKCDCWTPNSYYVIKGDAPIYNGCDSSDDGGFYSKADSNISTLGTLIDDVTAETVQAEAININTSCGTCGSNIDLSVAAHPRYISNTVFLNLGYNWETVNHKPYIGVIGDVEFGSNNSALRLWGLFVKGGFCF